MKEKILCTSSIIAFALSMHLKESFKLKEQKLATYLLTILA